MTHHPDDLASVTAANRDRLMGVAAAISTITNSDNTMIDLAELEAKARAATQGEWKYRPNPYDDWGVIRGGNPTEDGRLWYIARAASGRWMNDDEKAAHRSANTDPYHANAAYIVAAQPGIVLELIERVRAAEAKAGEPTEAMITAGAAEVRLGIAEKWSAEVIASEVHDAMQATRPATVDVSALQERVRVLEEALGKIESACLSEDDGSDEIVEIVFGTATAALKGRWRQR